MSFNTTKDSTQIYYKDLGGRKHKSSKPVNGSLNLSNIDRSLFAVTAIAFAIIAFVGFARTYYLRVFFDTPPLASMIVHLHAVLMTVWVLLFISQIWLISSKRIRVHQRLGFSSIALAVLIIVVGFLLAVRAAKLGHAPPNFSGLSFSIVPLTDLFNFTILFSAAIYLRKKPADHKRLMLLTSINFLDPAVARIPVGPLQTLGPIWFFGFPTALAFIALIVDWRKNRKLNKVFLFGILFVVASFVLRLAIMKTNAWLDFARWLTSWAT